MSDSKCVCLLDGEDGHCWGRCWDCDPHDSFGIPGEFLYAIPYDGTRCIHCKGTTTSAYLCWHCYLAEFGARPDGDQTGRRWP